MAIERVRGRLRAARASNLLHGLACVGLCAGALALGGCASGEAASAARGAPDTSGVARSSDQPAGSRDFEGLVTQIEGATIVHADWAELGYRWDWAVKPFLTGGSRVEHVDFGEGTIIAQDTAGWVTLLDAGNGRRRWAVEAGDRLTNFLGSQEAGNSVVLVPTRAELMGFERSSGNTILSISPELVLSSKPLVMGSVMIAGSPLNRVQARRIFDQAGNPLTGTLRNGLAVWQYRIDGAVRAAPVEVEGTAAIVSDNGEVLFLDPATGSATGRARISGGISTEAVSAAGALFLASEDQSLYAFTSRGERLWRHRTATPLTEQPRVVGFTLYVTIPGEGFHAFDAGSGSIAWVNDAVQGEVVATRGEDLVVWDDRARRAFLVQASTGDVIAEVNLPGYERLMAPSLEGGPIYALADSGAIVAFRTR